MESKKRVFVDMDGVLCEYRAGASVEDMEKSGYFYSLAPRKDMVDALNYLINSKEREVFILSAVLPQVAAQSTAEKNAWLNEHMPAIDDNHRIFTLCGMDKVAAISDFNSSDVLFDDYSSNLEKWNAAGGKAVKIINEVNGKNGTFKAGPRLKISSREDLVDILKCIA